MTKVTIKPEVAPPTRRFDELPFFTVFTFKGFHYMKIGMHNESCWNAICLETKNRDSLTSSNLVEVLNAEITVYDAPRS